MDAPNLSDRNAWECAVSLRCLLKFVKDHKKELEGKSTAQVVTAFVIPATEDKQCRYADILAEEDVAPPTYFISHTWGSTFLDLVSDINYQLEIPEDSPQAKQVFLWLDIFAVNQHRNTVSQKNDLAQLDTAIQKSNKTLVCMDKSCTLLTRIWCLFEIWHTFQLDIERLIIVTQNTRYDQLKELFINCDVAQARATVDSDRVRILREMEETIGHETMNMNIKKAIVESTRLEAEAISAHEDKKPLKASNIYTKFSQMLSFAGDFHGALPWNEKAFKIRKRLYGDKHIETAFAMNEMGFLLNKLGKYKEALPHYEGALAIRKSQLGENHSDTMISSSNLGFLYNKFGRYKETLPLYTKVYEYRTTHLGPENPQTVLSMNNLAFLLNKLGDYDQSLELYLEALEIRRRLVGNAHTETAMSCNNLAFLLNKMGRPNEAEPYYREALEIRKKVFGPNHPDVALCLNNLGSLLNKIGKYDEALPIYQEALRLREKLLGPKHPKTGVTLGNFAILLKNMGRTEESAKMRARADEIGSSDDE